MERIVCQNCGGEISIVACSYAEQVSSETFIKCVQEDDFGEMLMPAETTLEIMCPCWSVKLSETDKEFINEYFSYQV